MCSRRGKRFAVWLLVLLALLVWGVPRLRGLNRYLAAEHLYEQAVSAYMAEDVNRAQSLFEDVATGYADLPIGALSELKVAFLVYEDRHDLDRAETLVRRFLEQRSQRVRYFADSPTSEYEGELDLVAYFLLARIAKARGDDEQTVHWLERIVQQGSDNPANHIVAEADNQLRRVAQTTRKGASSYDD
jgi:hypothetical protein